MLNQDRIRSRFIIIMVMVIGLASCTSLKNPSATNNSKESRAEAAKDQALISKYEQLIGEPINIHKSLALYKSVDTWINTPYKYGSTVCREGTDCSGFVCSVYKEVYHIDLERTSQRQLREDVDRISKNRLKEGDLVFFRIDECASVSHVGIYLGNQKFVHASTKKGVCIDALDDKYYDQHFKAAGRVKANLFVANKDK